MADPPGGVPVLHSEILPKWITSSAIVTDQGPAQVDLRPDSAGDSRSAVMWPG
jgi:hypothetical protein